MRRIHMALCSLALVAAAAAPAAAQGGGGMGGGMPMDPAQMMQRMNDRMFAGITLSATQQDSVKVLNAKYAEDVKAMMAGGGMPDRQKMMESREKHQTALRAILTADQATTFDKNVAEMRNRMGGRPAGPPPNGQ